MNHSLRPCSPLVALGPVRRRAVWRLPNGVDARGTPSFGAVSTVDFNHSWRTDWAWHRSARRITAYWRALTTPVAFSCAAVSTPHQCIGTAALQDNIGLATLNAAHPDPPPRTWPLRLRSPAIYISTSRIYLRKSQRASAPSTWKNLTR